MYVYMYMYIKIHVQRTDGNLHAYSFMLHDRLSHVKEYFIYTYIYYHVIQSYVPVVTCSYMYIHEGYKLMFLHVYTGSVGMNALLIHASIPQYESTLLFVQVFPSHPNHKMSS